MAGTFLVDSSGAPMRAASSPVRMQARDGLGTAFASLGQGGFGGGYQQGPLSHFFALDLAFATYLASGLLQKVIDIPAADRTREWRDWQAEADQITAIEAEEKRLGLRAKIKAAEVLRGIGGGALILALPGPASEPAPVPGKGQLQAVNVVSRKQLELVDIDDDLTSATYGEPRLFRFQARGSPVDIHPTRVIPFRGDAYPPMMAGLSADDLYWGRSRLVRVVNEVAKSDNAALWFSHLIRKAKLLRFGISNLGDYDQADLNSRVSLIAQSENLLNATIYNLPAKDGSGGESGGEKIDDYSQSWTGIPAMMDAFDQRVAAVSGIPFALLMGRSPAGMNATGEYDMRSWHDTVADGQENELRPCLERLDAVMLPSAGVPTAGLWWKFSPLGKPTPEQEANRFKTTMDALKIAADLNAMPERALNAGIQGVIEANGWMPGSLPILAEMDEDERFGLAPDPDGSDPSAITQSGSGVEGGDPTSRQAPGASVEAEPRRRAANDKLEVGEDAGLPFSDARRVSQKHRLGRRETASHFNPDQPRDRNGRWIPSGIREVLKDAAQGRTGGKQVRLGSVGSRLASMAQKRGITIRSKDVALDPSYVRHVILRHGHETRSGQKAVKAGDIAAAATLVNGARTIRRVPPSKQGVARFAVVTPTRGQHAYAIFEDRKKGLTLVTMWMRG